ncbi:hypothetical protein ACIGEL_19115 [Rossellomorea aquimaris]|uniref:hypothetical protein n=1 Tax=Rossellomorea aquimaris TaxID=189382 RepID=UPI0037C55289
MQTRLPFPIHLKRRNILQNVIPTVCNIKNMLDKLDLYQGDETILKSWEKRCFSNYRLNTIKEHLVIVSTENRLHVLRKHILSLEPHELRSNVLDIYIIAFIAETYGPGKDNVVKFV